MTKKQQARLAKNRDSQRAALREHMVAGVVAHDPVRPMVASRPIDGNRPFNAYLRLPKRAA